AETCLVSSGHLRRDRDSADLGLHMGDRLASFSDPVHDHEHRHCRRMVATTAFRLAELADGSGLLYPRLGPTATLPGRISALVLRRPRAGAADAASGTFAP